MPPIVEPTKIAIQTDERIGPYVGSVGGNRSLAFAFFALLIDLDPGTGWVIDHREASPHALWAVALQWFDHDFFHQP